MHRLSARLAFALRKASRELLPEHHDVLTPVQDALRLVGQRIRSRDYPARDRADPPQDGCLREAFAPHRDDGVLRHSAAVPGDRPMRDRVDPPQDGCLREPVASPHDHGEPLHHSAAVPGDHVMGGRADPQQDGCLREPLAPLRVHGDLFGHSGASPGAHPMSDPDDRLQDGYLREPLAPPCVDGDLLRHPVAVPEDCPVRDRADPPQDGCLREPVAPHHAHGDLRHSAAVPGDHCIRFRADPPKEECQRGPFAELPDGVHLSCDGDAVVPAVADGSVVRFVGLNAGHLNGLLGLVRTWSGARGQWQVTYFCEDRETNVTSFFKECNLQLIESDTPYGSDDIRWFDDWFG